MGYQYRISTQQAGNFGLAQSRRRVIVWGTILDNHLAYYPEPTHRFHKIAINLTDYCVPHPAQTIYDVVANLEGFEYDNNIKIDTVYIGKMQTNYIMKPFSEFQRLSRQSAMKYFNHVTRSFNDITVERICRISMVPGSDHSSLSEKLKLWCLSRKGLFARLDFKGHFLTALTDIQSMGKQDTVIHLSQNKVITVREYGRA
ncbi:hypothetical protein K502DRAFT_351772 [Neoconidiobolus thromboides FSU 785]|nr:hypothetical protein K502DRAFT_351772 [Neoconidiobolus thromboides FSU 785]